MHKSFIFTETGIKNRRGASYRLYADGGITNIDLMGRVVAQDICEIFLAKESSAASVSDLKVMSEICNQLDIDASVQPIGLMALAFEFGFMMGGNAVRNNKNCEQKPIPSTANEKAPKNARKLLTNKPS